MMTVTVMREACTHPENERETRNAKDATCTVDGMKTARCDRCDATDTVTDEGTALGHSCGEVTYTWMDFA